MLFYFQELIHFDYLLEVISLLFLLIEAVCLVQEVAFIAILTEQIHDQQLLQAHSVYYPVNKSQRGQRIHLTFTTLQFLIILLQMVADCSLNSFDYQAASFRQETNQDVKLQSLSFIIIYNLVSVELLFQTVHLAPVVSYFEYFIV